jgi:hypothetical protein
MLTPESNGRPPEPAESDMPADAAADAAADSAADAAADAAADKLEAELNREFDDGRPSGLEVAFTPRQILGGFALLAGLILLLRRRKRGR